MPLSINGTTYFTAVEITESLSITRQTLWRWRIEGKVPAGRRFRDKQIIYTRPEFEAIERFANRVEPIAMP
jgi:predicted site-specific integrase-resolvase